VERSAVSADLSWECSSTGEVMGSRPTKVMKNGFAPAATLDGSAALLFTGNPGQCNGEICNSANLSWKCFPTKRVKRMDTARLPHALALRKFGFENDPVLFKVLVPAENPAKSGNSNRKSKILQSLRCR
jgi:hypothetical protein